MFIFYKFSFKMLLMFFFFIYIYMKEPSVKKANEEHLEQIQNIEKKITCV